MCLVEVCCYMLSGRGVLLHDVSGRGVLLHAVSGRGVLLHAVSGSGVFRVATVRENVREHFFRSRSGKCHGISDFLTKCQGIGFFLKMSGKIIFCQGKSLKYKKKSPVLFEKACILLRF